MLRDVLLVLDEFVADGLLGVRGIGTELRHAINHVGDEMKAVQIIHHHHVERSRGGAFLFVAAHVEVLVVGAAIREPMNHLGVFVVLSGDKPVQTVALEGASIALEVDETALDVGVDQLDVDAVAHVETLEPALQPAFGRRLEEPHPRSLRGGTGDEGVE
jgi:hypothetical protein